MVLIRGGIIGWYVIKSPRSISISEKFPGFHGSEGTSLSFSFSKVCDGESSSKNYEWSLVLPLAIRIGRVSSHIRLKIICRKQLRDGWDFCCVDVSLFHNNMEEERVSYSNRQHIILQRFNFHGDPTTDIGAIYNGQNDSFVHLQFAPCRKEKGCSKKKTWRQQFWVVWVTSCCDRRLCRHELAWLVAWDDLQTRLSTNNNIVLVLCLCAEKRKGWWAGAAFNLKAATQNSSTMISTLIELDMGGKRRRCPTDNRSSCCWKRIFHFDVCVSRHGEQAPRSVGGGWGIFAARRCTNSYVPLVLSDLRIFFHIIIFMRHAVDRGS